MPRGPRYWKFAPGIVASMAEARCDLNPREGERRFRQSHALPVDPAVTPYVDAYWMVDWELPAADPYVHESIPDPAIHLVVQQNQSRLVGVCTGRFTYTLEGRGRIFGARFRPAAARAYTSVSAAALTDTVRPLAEVFGSAAAELEGAVLATNPDDDAAAVAVVEGFLRDRARPDRNIDLVQRIADAAASDREIRRIEDLVDRFHLSARTLQRLFSAYIGVSPAWVIRRHRLIEAADRVIGDDVSDWAGLASSLGYFDQAHFINDFASIIGSTPAAHAKRVRA